VEETSGKKKKKRELAGRKSGEDILRVISYLTVKPSHSSKTELGRKEGGILGRGEEEFQKKEG